MRRKKHEVTCADDCTMMSICSMLRIYVFQTLIFAYNGLSVRDSQSSQSALFRELAKLSAYSWLNNSSDDTLTDSLYFAPCISYLPDNFSVTLGL